MEFMVPAIGTNAMGPLNEKAPSEHHSSEEWTVAFGMFHANSLIALSPNKMGLRTADVTVSFIRENNLRKMKKSLIIMSMSII
jgi:hypothetical protein